MNKVLPVLYNFVSRLRLHAKQNEIILVGVPLLSRNIRTAPSFLIGKTMRIGENLSPFWRNVTSALVLLQHSLLFIVAISALWGWYVVGYGSCLLLTVGIFEQRHHYLKAFKAKIVNVLDRLITIYMLLLGLVAIIINFVLIVFWLVNGRHPYL